ncbi:MAG: hypothetical protein ACREJP_10010 [Candidatus Methylomirabilales bacterium]
MNVFVDRKRTAVLAALLALTLALVAATGDDAFAKKKKKKKKGPVAIPATSFYFHGGTPPINQLGAHTFDTTTPTAQGALAPASQGLGQTPHPVWAGDVPAGQATKIVLDFWQKAPVDEMAFSEVNYDVTLVADGVDSVFPPFTAPVMSNEVPSHVVWTFEAGFPGAPLPLLFAGGAVEIEIAGHFTDGEAVTVIVYDTADFPSGFAINPAA